MFTQEQVSLHPARILWPLESMVVIKDNLHVSAACPHVLLIILSEEKCSCCGHNPASLLSLRICALEGTRKNKLPKEIVFSCDKRLSFADEPDKKMSVETNGVPLRERSLFSPSSTSA